MGRVALGEIAESTSAPTVGFDATVGTLIGERWILREELGRGASSIVWRATHELLGKDVAIKFLAPSAVASSGSAQQNMLERFRFEAQVSSTLAAKTAEIVAVHDAGVFSDVPFIVMDLVRGDSVASLLLRDAMTLELTVKMARDVARALDACHDVGIAHRDTKPANILLVSTTSTFKLTDFGLAKHFGPVPPGSFVPRNTDGAMLVGTPAYMGPEAISAERTACGRGDVWSLAVTLYECLVRTLPFDGEAWPAVAVAVINRSFVRPSVHREELARFDALFDKAFAEEINERFQSSSELADAFERAALLPRASTKRPEPADDASELVSGDQHPPAPTVVDLEAATPPMRRSFFVPVMVAVGLGAAAIGAIVLLTGDEPRTASVESTRALTPLSSSPTAPKGGPTANARPTTTSVEVVASAASEPKAVVTSVTTTTARAATTPPTTPKTAAANASAAKPPSKPRSPSEVW